MLGVGLIVRLNGVQEAASCQHQGKGSDAFLMILRLGVKRKMEPPRESLQLENLEAGVGGKKRVSFGLELTLQKEGQFLVGKKLTLGDPI